MKEEYWVTKEGKKIAVADLTEEHAKNILRYLIKYKRLEEESEGLYENYPGESWDNGQWYVYNGNE